MPVVDERTANDILDRVLRSVKNALRASAPGCFSARMRFLSKQSAPLPEEEYYEGYVQLENGVGMLRSMEMEFMSALRQLEPDTPCRPFAIGTGCLAAPFIRELVDKAKERCPAVQGTVYAVVNHYFGETIDVAGLVTATDLMTQLKGQPLGERLLLPANMLRHGGDIFLDDYRVSDVERALG